MKISDTRLAEFRKIYKERFGTELSPKEAYDKASGLLQLVNLVYRPLSDADLAFMKHRRFETFVALLDHFAVQEEEEAL